MKCVLEVYFSAYNIIHKRNYISVIHKRFKSASIIRGFFWICERDGTYGVSFYLCLRLIRFHDILISNFYILLHYYCLNE